MPREHTPKKNVPEVFDSVATYFYLGKKYDQPAEQALFYLLYLTGGRVSEVLKLRCDSIRIEQYYSQKEKEWKRIPMVDLPTLKNKKIRLRKIPIRGQYEEKEMWKFLRVYIEGQDDKLFPWSRYNAYVRLRKQRIYIRMFNHNIRDYEPDKQLFRIHPHWLRHSRLTHLATLYNMGIYNLVAFAGWSDAGPAMRYVRMSPANLADALVV